MIQSSSLKKIVFLLVIFFFIINSIAQFNVVSTSPANGATNISTAATVSITFNAAIDTNAIFNFPDSMFVSLFFIPDSLVYQLDSITLSPDLKTIYFHNWHLHRSNTYKFCILNAVSTSGDSLDVPYSFTFWTTSVLPGYYATLSGMIDYPGGDPTGAIVFLFKTNPFEDEESRIENWAVVSNSSGMFTIDYVDSGFCWPTVIKDFYLDEDGEIQIKDGSKIGFNDHNADLRPDSNYIFIGSTVSGLNLVLSDVYLRTSRGSYPDLETLSHNWASDSYLTELGTGEFNPIGKSIFWQYAFYSPSLSRFKYWLTAGDLIVSIKQDSMDADTLTIPNNWLDSDTIMTIAENNGGYDFRQQNQDVDINAGCRVFVPNWIVEQKLKNKIGIPVFEYNDSVIKTTVWRVLYDSNTTPDTLQLLIDAVTGAVLNPPVTASEAEQIALDYAHDWSMDAELTILGSLGSPVNTLGESEFWSCLYYSVSLDSLHYILMWGKLAISEGPPHGVFFGDPTQIVADGWLDSDSTLNSAEFNGGYDYRINNQNVYINATLSRWVLGLNSSLSVWVFIYYSSTAGPLEIIIDAHTGEFITSIDKLDDNMLLNTFKLNQNFPNPFNPKTNISFHLQRPAKVELKIYNLAGQVVGIYDKGKLSAGYHTINWHAGNLSSGVYYYKITAGEYSAIKKCILLK